MALIRIYLVSPQTHMRDKDPQTHLRRSPSNRYWGFANGYVTAADIWRAASTAVANTHVQLQAVTAAFQTTPPHRSQMQVQPTLIPRPSTAQRMFFLDPYGHAAVRGFD